MSLKFPPFPTEIFVAPHLERPQGRTAPFQSVSPPLQLPRWNLAPPVVLLAVRGDLSVGSRGPHSRPSGRGWAQATDTMAAHRRRRPVSWEDTPCLGCLFPLCTPQAGGGSQLGSVLAGFSRDLSVQGQGPQSTCWF